MSSGSWQMLSVSGRLGRGVVVGLLLLGAVAASEPVDGGVNDGGASRPVSGRCQHVRGEPYRRSVRAHVLVKYGLEFERCALPNSPALQFEVGVGGQSSVRFDLGTKEQRQCVRTVLNRIVLPAGIRRAFEFRFDGKPSLHDPLTLAEIADAGGREGGGRCVDDGQCWPGGVCSCGSDHCSAIPDSSSGTDARGVCVSFDAFACVQEFNRQAVERR